MSFDEIMFIVSCVMALVSLVWIAWPRYKRYRAWTRELNDIERQMKSGDAAEFKQGLQRMRKLLGLPKENEEG